MQHAVCTIGHGLFGRDPLRSHWSALGVIVIVTVIVIMIVIARPFRRLAIGK